MSEDQERKEHEFNSYHSSIARSYLLGDIDLYSTWSKEELKAMISNPMANNEELRHLSEVVYNSNGIATNTIDYMCALPTMDRVVIPCGDSKVEERRELVTNVLDYIRDEEIGRDCLLNTFVRALQVE